MYRLEYNLKDLQNVGFLMVKSFENNSNLLKSLPHCVHLYLQGTKMYISQMMQWHFLWGGAIQIWYIMWPHTQTLPITDDFQK